MIKTNFPSRDNVFVFMWFPFDIFTTENNCEVQVLFNTEDPLGFRL